MSDSIRCPRCGGTGRAVWRQCSGGEVPITCGLCRGTGRCEARLAAGESKKGGTK